MMIKYLLEKIPNAKTFGSLADTKVQTLLQSCNQRHDPSDRYKYLVIGESIVAHGLANLGYNVSTIEGLSYEHPNLINHTGTLEELVKNNIQYDYVIALDEWLCNAKNEQEQLEKIKTLPRIAKRGFYTSVKDYKNMGSRDRFFEEPFELRTNSGNCIILRQRDWDRNDRQAWIQRNYVIQNDNLQVIEPKHCRTMYFKQLAKFSHDAGAKDFQVDKKLMYKPLFSKSFEYIVYISF
jgi:hypothetical protein